MDKRFNPGNFPRPAKQLSVLPRHGDEWSKKWANWWAGATIASPTNTMVAPAAWALRTVKELYDDPDGLNEFYIQRTEWARELTREVLALPKDAPVILDASGTAAILTATRMLAHVALLSGKRELFSITTNEGGSLVPATLKGKDPNDIDLVMFQPGTMLFYEPSPVLPYPGERLQTLGYHMINLSDLDNDQFVKEIERLIEGNADKAISIMLPHVVKTGRILPIREVGEVVRKAREAGLTVFYTIDDVQGIGRSTAEAIANPLSFADAYLFGASKALGALLIASAIAIRQEHVDEFLKMVSVAVASGNELPAANTRWLNHFQFSPELEELIPAQCFKSSALSLPEIVSMSAALQHHYMRGVGSSYSERRINQLKLVQARRAELVRSLLTVPGAVVLEPTSGKPIVPSIVSFRLERKGNDWMAPASLKRELQESDPIVTPTAPIGRWLRLDIPEYREMPSTFVLTEKIRRIIAHSADLR